VTDLSSASRADRAGEAAPPTLAPVAPPDRRTAPGRAAAVVALALGGLAAVAAGPFLLDTYTVNILVRSFLYAAVALTVDVLWGYTGILTFGQSAFFGIGGYAAGLAFTHYGFSPLTAGLALLAGVAFAALVAAFVGWISFWHRASPLYVAIVTLALPIIVVQLLYSGGTLTGSSSGLVGFDTFDLSVEAWFWIAGGGLVLLTAAAWFFVSSDFGRLLVAIRENEQRSQYLGTDTARLKIMLMAATAVIAAAAGYAYAGYTVVVAPEIAGFVFGTELVIWVALGGRGTLIGPVLGTIVIDLATAYLSGSLPYVWKLIVGVLFVIVIVVVPQGLVPLFVAAGRRLRAVGGQGAAERVWAPRLEMAPAHRAFAAGSTAKAIDVSDLVRNYGSLRVLDGVSFTTRHGELVSIVGPNGAGKTTLMRCLSDGFERNSGHVAVNGESIGRQPPYAIVALGLGRSFQTTNLYETLTVADCLRVARSRLVPLDPWRRSGTLSLPEAAMRVVTATGLDWQLGLEARHLSHGLKRALELTMVLALEPSVLLLDEPTAGLTKQERTLIGSILVDLTKRDDLCVLLIEHDLDFVREISSRVIVLHQGRVVLDGSVQDVVASELVRGIYAGHAAEPAHGEPAR
jgi:branched-chain amino acid transport system permease protein